MVKAVKTFFIAALLLATWNLHSATFIPISFYKQAEESHGAIHAIYQGATGKKLKNNEIVTEASFKILKSSGINQNDIKNKESFKIIYPGGVWEGIGSYVSGTPSFTENEEVVLLVKKTRHGFILNGLSLGKYTFTAGPEGKKYLTSSVFPDHKDLGKVDFQEANLIFKNLYGEVLSDVSTDRFVQTINSSSRAQNPIGNRSPASVVDNDEEEQAGSWGIFWLVMLFTAMGCVTTVTLRREKNK